MRVAIVLAAGSSRRFGRANKLLARIGRETMLDHAIRSAGAAPVGRVIVVTGADRLRVGQVARRRGAAIVHARDHASGMSASLRAGLRAVWPIERMAYIFLGDMPLVPRDIAGKLARALGSGFDAARPVAGGQPGHPVLLRMPGRSMIARIEGDAGMRSLLESVALVPVGSSFLIDIDHFSDWVGTIRRGRRFAAPWKILQDGSRPPRR